MTAVTEAFYRVDEGEWQPVNATTAETAGLDIKPITIENLALGPHRIQYYAIDSAGNKSAEAELPIVVAPPDVAVQPQLEQPVVRARDEHQQLVVLAVDGPGVRLVGEEAVLAAVALAQVRLQALALGPRARREEAHEHHHEEQRHPEHQQQVRVHAFLVPLGGGVGPVNPGWERELAG